MPKRVLPLSDVQVKKAKATDKQYRLTDGDGLYLIVTEAGSKLWRFDYRFNGVRKTAAFGTYPELSLSDVREMRKNARSLVAHDVDPGETKKAQRVAGDQQANTFEVIAREWHAKFKHTWVEKHGKHKLQRLENNIFPWIGKTPITEVTAPELLACLRRVEVRGALDLAHRIRTSCVQVFQYAIATGRCERNIAADLKGSLPPAKVTHYGAPTEPEKLGFVLKAIEDYTGGFATKCALQLSTMLLVRPGILRHMEWLELDLELGNIWSVPAGKMKMDNAHIVPLPLQAVAILKVLKPLTGHSKYVFPCVRSPLRCMSDNTINAALRRMGFTKDEATGHGFRATARTIMDEVLDIRPDFIEHQLAHAVKDPNGRAYNRTAHLPARKIMMQQWADYLEGLKTIG